MKIFYSKRKTINLGNYENVVIHISGEDDVNDMVETKEECFTRLKLFVDSKLEEELDQTKNGIVTHNKIKTLIMSLVNKNEHKRDIIKHYMISHYNTTKVNNLNNDDLVKLNNYLIGLL
jgi:hypothetical protein